MIYPAPLRTSMFSAFVFGVFKPEGSDDATPFIKQRPYRGLKPVKGRVYVSESEIKSSYLFAFKNIKLFKVIVAKYG